MRAGRRTVASDGLGLGVCELQLSPNGPGTWILFLYFYDHNLCIDDILDAMAFGKKTTP
jgi:hypothetical protein